MIKVTTKNGCRLLCGKLLPLRFMACGFMNVLASGFASHCFDTLEPDQTCAVGSVWVLRPARAIAGWVWEGSSVWSNVTVSEPPCSPKNLWDNPAPSPGCIGALP